MPILSLEEIKRDPEYANLSPKDKRDIDQEYGIADTTKPTLGERIIGNIQLGIGDTAARTIGAARFITGLASDSQPGGVDSAGRTDINAALDTARKNVEDYWGSFESAKKVTARPAETMPGQIAEGLVRFAPEIPLWATGEAPISAGLRMLGAAPKLGKLAGFSRYLSEAPKGPIQEYLGVAARGAMVGGEVGAITAKPGERGEKALEEAKGFAIAAPLFHAGGKALKAGLKYGFEKATPWLESQKDISDINAKYSLGTNELDQVITFNRVLDAKKYAQENYGDRPWKVVKDQTTGKSFIGLDRPTKIELRGVRAEDNFEDMPSPETLVKGDDEKVFREIDPAKLEPSYSKDLDDFIRERDAQAKALIEPTIAEKQQEIVDKYGKQTALMPGETPVITERDRLKQQLTEAYTGDPQHVTAFMALSDANAKIFSDLPLEDYYKNINAEAGKLSKLGPDQTPLNTWGYTEFDAVSGKIVTGLYSTAKVNTLIHEGFHIYEGQLAKFKDLRPDLVTELDAWYKSADPNAIEWAKANKYAIPEEGYREYLPTAFTSWMKDKSSVTPALDSIFTKFSIWLKQIYKSLKGTEEGVDIQGVKVSPALDKFFQKLTNLEVKEIVTKVNTPKVETPGVEIAIPEPAKSWENFTPKTETTVIPNSQKAKVEEKLSEINADPADSKEGLALNEMLKKNPEAIKTFTGEQLTKLEQTKEWEQFLSDPLNNDSFRQHLSDKQLAEWAKAKQVKTIQVYEETEPGFYGNYKKTPAKIMDLVGRLEEMVKESESGNIKFQTVSIKDQEALVGYAEEVRKVLESGREVPLTTLNNLKDLDPVFKEAYDAKLAQNSKERTREREAVIANSAERAIDNMDSDIGKTKAERYSADVIQKFGPVMEALKNTGKASKSDFDNAVMLQERVSDGIRLTENLLQASEYSESFKKAVIPADMEAITKLESLTNLSLTPQQHIAGVILEDGTHVGGLLDLFRSAELLLKRDPQALVKNREASMRMLDEVSKAYEAVVDWHQRINMSDPNLFKPDQYIRMLRKGEGLIEDIWKTSLTTKNPFMWGIYKNIVSMHWVAKDFPVLGPIYRSFLDKLHQTTILSGDIIKGDTNNRVMFQGREVRLQGFEPFMALRDLDKQAHEIAGRMLWQGDKDGVNYHMLTRPDGTKNFRRDLLDVKILEFDPTLSEVQVERVARGYLAVRETFDWMFGKTIDSFRGKADTPNRVLAVEKLLSEKLNYYEGYMPHLREGKWAVGVFDKTFEKTIKTPVRDTDGNIMGYTSESGTKTYELHQVPNINELRYMEKQLREKYPDKNVRRLTPDEHANIATSARREAVGTIKSIFDEAVNSPDIARSKFAEEMLSQSIAELTDLGFFTHFKSRANVDIPGYDTRPGAVMLKQAQGFANFISRQEFSEKGWNELSKLQRGGPGYGKLYNYAADWMNTMLQSGNGVDKIIARGRSLVFLQMLGFNIKSSFVTIAEKFTNAPFVLGQYSKNGAVQNMKGMSDIVTYNKWKVEANKLIIAKRNEGLDYNMTHAMEEIGHKSGLSVEELKALYELSHQGDLRAQYTEEMSGFEEARYDTIQDPISSGLARAHDYVEKGLSGLSRMGSFLISNAERMGRESTALAAFRIFRNEKGYSYDYAKQMASELVRDIHYQYGKANQQTWLNKGVGKYLKLALTFRTQEMNYINMLTHLWGSTGLEGRKAVVKSLGVLTALGGISSVPFVYATNELFKKFYGTSPLEYVRQKINSSTDTEWLSSIVNDGGPAALGITVQPSLRVASDSSLSEALGGVSLSLGKQLWSAKDALGDRDYMTFLEKALPAAAANPLKAYDRWNYGVINARGKTLSDSPLDPPTKLNTYEAILNGMGFQSEKVIRQQSKVGLRIADAAYWSSQRKSIYGMIQRGITKGNTDLVNRGFDKLSKYNQDAPPDKIIMPQAILQSLQDRPGMKELMAETRLFGS